MRLSARRLCCSAAILALFLLLLCSGSWRRRVPPILVQIFEVHQLHGFLHNSTNCTTLTRPPQLSRSDWSSLVDLPNFEFLLNNSTCAENSPLVVLVHSAPDNLQKRLQIRNTWGSILQGALFFVLGQVDSHLQQASLEQESIRYKDLVQGSFRDAYRNMTYKHVASLKWALHFCPQAHYVLKTDDDTFVNTPGLLALLPHCRMKNLVLCHVWTAVPVARSGPNKWTVTRDEFGDDVYPNYCSGTAILYSQDVVYRLHQEAQRTPYFWVDDVHVTGTLVQKLNLTHRAVSTASLSVAMSPNKTIVCNRQEDTFLFSRHNITARDMDTLWQYANHCTQPS